MTSESAVRGSRRSSAPVPPGCVHISEVLREFMLVLDRTRRRHPEMAEVCRSIAEGLLRDAERPPIMPWPHPKELGPSPIGGYWKPVDDPWWKHLRCEDVCQRCLPGAPGAPAFVGANLRAYIPEFDLGEEPVSCARCGRAFGGDDGR